MKQKKYGIGIDIGGTKISIVLGTRQAQILEKCVLETPREKDFQTVFKTIRKTIDGMLGKRSLSLAQIQGVGVGVPGFLNATTGILEESPNLRSWVGINFIKSLRRVLPVPVRVENDANSTAVAAKIFGLGRGIKNFVYITVSTGVGSGIIIDGKLFRGASGSAGEIGHTIVRSGGWVNHLGVAGTLEGEASGTAIRRKALKVMSQSKLLSKFYKDNNEMMPQFVKAAALKGDKIALKIFEAVAQDLAVGISNVIMFLNPERIILGGGVLKGKGGKLLLGLVIQKVKKLAWPRPFKACSIVRTCLLDKIADLGALSLAFD